MKKKFEQSEVGKPASPVPIPSTAESAAIETARQRVRTRTPRITVKFSQAEDGSVDLQGASHSDHEGWLARLEDAFGTRGTSFAISQINQLMSASQNGKGRVDATRVDAMLAMVEAARPENELQAAMAVQMVVTHFAAIELTRRTMKADGVKQFDCAGNMAVKLLRTFVLQAEALAKLQRGGEQIVKVVHVHAGARAVIGDVHNGTTGASGATGAGGGVADENQNQPHAKAITAAAGPPAMPPLWRQDEERQPVPVTGRDG